MYHLIKVGSDTELFLVNSNNIPTPVCGLVGGTKENPLPVLGGKGFAVQEDNVMLEFNVPPASSAKDFADNMDKIVNFLTEEMRKKELKVVPLSYLSFDTATIKNMPQANKFGCDPDFNVWARSVNYPVDPILLSHRGRAARMAGLHVHVSFDVDGNEPTLEEKEWLVKAKDFFLGLGSVLISHWRIEDAKRRNWYGRAGAFRFKPYGLEYRVLGSSLLGLGRPVFDWIFRQTENAIRFASDDQFRSMLATYGPSIQHAINSSDAGMVQELYKVGSFAVPHIREACDTFHGL